MTVLYAEKDYTNNFLIVAHDNNFFPFSIARFFRYVLFLAIPAYAETDYALANTLTTLTQVYEAIYNSYVYETHLGTDGKTYPSGRMCTDQEKQDLTLNFFATYVTGIKKPASVSQEDAINAILTAIYGGKELNDSAKLSALGKVLPDILDGASTLLKKNSNFTKNIGTGQANLTNNPAKKAQHLANKEEAEETLQTIEEETDPISKSTKRYESRDVDPEVLDKILDKQTNEPTSDGDNLYTLLNIQTELTSADMAEYYGFSTDSKDIRAWFVTERKGLPALIGTPAEAGEELLHLRCERIYISGDKLVGETLTDTWSNKHVIQDGILDIFFELNTDKNVLDCYILSSGGTDGKSHTVPSTWPIHAKMKPGDPTDHILNISRASWRLRNITKDFFKQ